MQSCKLHLSPTPYLPNCPGPCGLFKHLPKFPLSSLASGSLNETGSTLRVALTGSPTQAGQCTAEPEQLHEWTGGGSGARLPWRCPSLPPRVRWARCPQHHLKLHNWGQHSAGYSQQRPWPGRAAGDRNLQSPHSVTSGPQKQVNQLSLLFAALSPVAGTETLIQFLHP